MELCGGERLCFFTVVLYFCVAAASEAPRVHTALGSLKGEYVTVKGKETGVYAYLAVPFAKPPVGPGLRFAPPQKVEGWQGVRDATKQPPMCVQHRQFLIDLLDMIGGIAKEIPDISEDCLYLNIYTPANRAPDTKLPVMVWIHGGGFTLGSASMYDGSAIAAYQDVVVVAIQYRLGALGFLSTGDEHVPGNFGLLDQVEALRWVQEHIENFGGDPASVTIFGESAGGVSVSLLLLSPLSHGLIHRAIAESGTAAMDAFLSNDPLPVAQLIANASGCSIESTKKIAACLKKTDFDTFQTLAQDPNLRFTITTDGYFLKKTINELFEKHEILKIPFMTGVNDHEGGWLIPAFMAPPNWTEGMDREQVLNTFVLFSSNLEDSIVMDLMADEYLGDGEDRVKNRDAFTEFFGDMLFTIPAIKTANAHRDAGAHVYLYEYQHPPNFMKAKRPSFVRCDHADELFTVLGFCFTTGHIKLNATCLEEEEELSRTMMAYWGNFARTGSPNGDGLAYWPNYGKEEKYLVIKAKEQVVAQHLRKDRFVFMTQILPEKVRLHQEKIDHGEL
ncbi:fatty acyl-CoA hydrolase precursor, medium chain [Corythoichthys intestinalis]|uniref:fatty acyl-CoA hydrolase precursor, medium chain n=1 Tax=Corythoichthys intestinalis TaxID=161448 RepID=UPI0025A53544|nr:fatty acyl-CoA hydrolase precursor, medium chain [Corythoichthys intestinalis]XP_057692744.1 fatty acyl-CoA hydrolase precursor, medium chain [Corythoichthys intestinalis]